MASFKQATGLGLKDSDSSHALRLKTSSNLTDNRTLDLVTGDADRTLTLSGNLTVSGAATLPAGTALVAANNLSDVSSGATAFSNIKQAASDSATGVQENAVQSEMEAASSTTLTVTPGRQHFHPAHPKAGGVFVGSGVPAFASGDVGMGAITDGGTGNYTLALDTAFATVNYWINGWARSSGTTRRAAVSANNNDTVTDILAAGAHRHLQLFGQSNGFPGGRHHLLGRLRLMESSMSDPGGPRCEVSRSAEATSCGRRRHSTSRRRRRIRS